MIRGAILLGACVVGFVGCDKIPGKPDAEHRWRPPSENLDFEELYARNCAGCHALEPGTLAASRPMDPLYLAFIGKENLRMVIADGVKGTTMPGFLDSNGGALTSDQIDALVEGLMAHAAEEQVDFPYMATAAGNPAAGKAAQEIFCASCHGEEGKGTTKGGSIVDPAYLSLVTDQSLRSTIVAGRPALGMPDYRGLSAEREPTEQEIADIVAWLSSKRPPGAQVVTAEKPASGKASTDE